MAKIILDLCGGTGAWSKPYKDAGYDVHVITLPGHDVLDYYAPPGVYGVLAAPPCTQFSIARQNAKTPRDFAKGMETVNACMRIIRAAMIQGATFWAMENPASGYLDKFMGKPALTFQPLEFGDPYTKFTALWGYFNPPKPTPIKLNFGQRWGDRDYERNLAIPEEYVMPPDMDSRQVRRSITPSGFAEAFFKANR